MTIEIETYVDGGNQGIGKRDIEKAFLVTWKDKYQGQYGSVVFLPPIDLKRASSGHERLDRAADVRNPDIFFWGRRLGPLLGVEITTHSPDGSNIEKRYPFLWAARREGLSAIVATPYLKVRPRGQINRLPYRHANHNRQLAEAWRPVSRDSSIQQLLPLSDLMGGDVREVPQSVRDLMWSWAKVGELLAHLTASNASDGRDKAAIAALARIRGELLDLSRACMAETSHTEASTLHREGDRWIQVFNARPETGWWERGEGQFDSIDGRVMFTISELDLLPPGQRPNSFELWLPQMTTMHPWIQEQVTAGYGSKRFRNLAQLLPASRMNVAFSLRFADQLEPRDWRILQANPSMCLERLVAPHAQLLRIGDYLPASQADEVAMDAQHGLSDADPIRRLVQSGDVYVATSRAYVPGWDRELESLVRGARFAGDIYVPRVPQRLLQNVNVPTGTHLRGGENTGRPLLLLLRYVHRYGHMPA